MIKSNSKLKNALTAGVLGQKTIKSVKLIGVTNQVVDTKLHAFLNWQEHIQANVYSFFVRYTDGTSRTVETYDQDEVSYYMSFVEREEKRVNKSKETFGRDEVFNQLTQLVNLKDRNVISDEVFERERNLLLAKLDESVSDEDTDKGYNLWIHRTKKRSAGNAKEHLISINDEKDDKNGYYPVLSSIIAFPVFPTFFIPFLKTERRITRMDEG